MIRRLGYVRHIMIGGDARGAPDFGRVVLPGPARPHTHSHTFFSGPHFSRLDFIYTKNASSRRLDFTYTKNGARRRVAFYLHNERLEKNHVKTMV